MSEIALFFMSYSVSLVLLTPVVIVGIIVAEEMRAAKARKAEKERQERINTELIRFRQAAIDCQMELFKQMTQQYREREGKA